MMSIDDQIRERALKWFLDLRDEQAGEDAWLAFCDWLEADDRHRRAYDAVEAAWVDVEAAEPEAAVAAVIPLRPARRPGRRTPWTPVLALAATIVLALGAWLVLRPAAFVDYRTEGEPRTIVMADGSSIYMNRRSELSVSTDPRVRTVRLEDGEAAFEVTHDAARPFVVESGGRSVTVLGTVFNVLNHGSRFEVAVQRGVVEVDSPRGTATRLEAGRKLVQRGQARASVSTLSGDQVLSWRDGVLVYRDSPLSEVGEDLSRYFGKPVTVDAAAGSLRFTGVLQLGDEAQMLKQLEDFVPVRVRRSSTGIALAGRDAG
jgi:transmembrane sensor